MIVLPYFLGSTHKHTRTYTKEIYLTLQLQRELPLSSIMASSRGEKSAVFVTKKAH